MSNDGCKRSDAGGRKTASGIIVYLMEELGDARLRCAQLKKHVHDATELIEKSKHRDHFFEVAGNLIYGIPDTLLKLDKALDATALAAARLDYEEIKNGLRPEKADELETALEETRLRYLNRRSNEEPMAAGRTKHLPGKPGHTLCGETAHPDTIVDSVKDSNCFYCVTAWEKANNAGSMYSRRLHATTDQGVHASTGKESAMNAKSAAYFLNKIADLTDKQGRVPVAAVMTLVARLEKGDKRAATLSGKASTAFRNIAKALTTEKNPSRVALAGVLRRIVGDTLQVGTPQQPVGGQQQQQQQGAQQGQGQQMMAGPGEDFQKANPKITDEEAKVIDEMHDEHKDVVKDKHEQQQQQQ